MNYYSFNNNNNQGLFIPFRILIFHRNRTSHEKLVKSKTA